MSSKENTQPHWHPDFKIESTLPDIKIIRTNFVINSIVLVLVVLSSALLIQRESRSYLLQRSINDLEQQVQNASPENMNRLGKSKQFCDAAQNVKELQQFFQVPFFAHESVVELASLKPEDLTFSRVACNESATQIGKQIGRNKNAKIKPKLKFQIDIKGNVQDLPILTEFKRLLEESALLNPEGFEVSIDENIQQRDSDTGIIPFQITVSLVSAKK